MAKHLAVDCAGAGNRDEGGNNYGSGGPQVAMSCYL